MLNRGHYFFNNEFGPIKYVNRAFKLHMQALAASNLDASDDRYTCIKMG